VAPHNGFQLLDTSAYMAQLSRRTLESEINIKLCIHWSMTNCVYNIIIASFSVLTHNWTSN